MEMKIIPANGGGPGMDGVFLSGYGDGDYTSRPRSGPLPSLLTMSTHFSFNSNFCFVCKFVGPIPKFKLMIVIINILVQNKNFREEKKNQNQIQRLKPDLKN